MKDEHIEIINKLLKKEYMNILDLGSGKTSMGILLNKFPNSNITGICYPGDNRKLDSIKENCVGNYELIEMDICKEQPKQKYDLILCHLLLGETLKFGNNLMDMLNGIFSIETNNICIIDYLEDPYVDFDLIESFAIKKGYKIKEKHTIKKEKEEVYEDFIGKHYMRNIIRKITEYLFPLFFW